MSRATTTVTGTGLLEGLAWPVREGLSNNEVHLTRSAGETERPLQVTSVLGGREAGPMRSEQAWRTLALISVMLGATASSASESVLGFELGAVNLHGVLSKLGPAELIRTGDASTSETSICYQTEHGEFVTFASNSEMASPGLELTAIRLSKSPLASQKCARYPEERALRLSNGLALGSTEAEVKSVAAGERTPEGGYVLCSNRPFRKASPEYERWASAKGCFGEGEEPYYTVCTGLEAKFEDGRVVWVEVSRIESVC